jgi:hypothetical protein
MMTADSADDDPVTVTAGPEGDVGVAAKRALDVSPPGDGGVARQLARLALGFERRRFGAEPDVLPRPHTSCS